MDFNPAHPLSIQSVATLRPGTKILKLVGPVTIHNFSQFQEITQKHLLPDVLLVDLSDVSYIDSSALGSFVAIHVNCEGTARKYALVGPNERLKNIFELAYVHNFLVICDSMAQAEEHLFPA